MEDKSLVVIGSTGTGKSSICNVLAGRKHDDKDYFPASGAMESCTNKTTAKRVNWRGNPALSFTLIDTPGLNDPEPGKDSLNIAEMADELKKMQHINVFLIVFNGSNPRFDNSLIAMIRIFQNMFGREFVEKNTVFEFSNWAHDKKSVRRRGTEKNESHWIAELNKRLRELVGSQGDVPAVFIDSLYDEEDDQEINKFEEEMDKLKKYLTTFPPYSCEGFEAVKTQLDQAEEDKKNLAAQAEAVKKEKERLEEEARKKNVDLGGNVSTQGSPTNANRKLGGINISNDLTQDISDIEIISVMTDKLAGGENSVGGYFETAWNYTTDWRTVDTTASTKSEGNWTSREIITGNGEITAGNSGFIACQPSFNEKYRHYWMFKCKIGSRRYKMDMTNKMINVYDSDAGTKPRFTLRLVNGDVRLNIIMDSGTSHVGLVSY